MALVRWVGALIRFPARTVAFLARGDRQLKGLADEVQRARQLAAQSTKLSAQSAKLSARSAKREDAVRAQLRAVRNEVAALRAEVHERLLQNTLVATRAARALSERSSIDGSEVQLSSRVVPVEAGPSREPAWNGVGDEGVAVDPEGRDWLTLDSCPACGHPSATVVSPWNKLILLEKAPDATSARYDYAMCHACGITFASRRPCGQRYRFLLANFGEVTAKVGGEAFIADRVLNPYPLTPEDREELRRLASPGVFVSDHLGLKSNEFLASLLRDRFANSAHTDIIGALLAPRGWRVLEVRSKTGTILDGLRRAWDARVCAMPIWESQQLVLREVYQIDTSDLIDFDHFGIPFDGPFDLILCNHMLTHVVRPAAFFAELRAKLRPGGHIYLHNEPDDADYLKGNKSMLASLIPLHLQAFDRPSLARALSANGFLVVFQKRQKNGAQFCLAKLADVSFTPMTDRERETRLEEHRAAFDRAVLRVGDSVRPRLADEWPKAIESAVVRGIAEFDERGQLRIVEEPRF